MGHRSPGLSPRDCGPMSAEPMIVRCVDMARVDSADVGICLGPGRGDTVAGRPVVTFAPPPGHTTGIAPPPNDPRPTTPLPNCIRARRTSARLVKGRPHPRRTSTGPPAPSGRPTIVYIALQQDVAAEAPVC
jgi:hypothetical protein